MKQAIAYYRVSTGRQGRSGLGLEAQQLAVQHYCKMNDFYLLEEVVEVKSTRKHRAGLIGALELCKQNKATLVVARLDRLGRDVEHIARIFNQKSKVEVKVADNPYANRFTIHILAAVAEDQRQRISETTKEALKAAKNRGVILGKHGRLFLSVANKQAAEDFARKLSPVIQRMKKRGIITSRAVCNELNKKSVPTFRTGGKWHPSSVHTLMTRINKQQQELQTYKIPDMLTTNENNILFDDLALINSLVNLNQSENTSFGYGDCSNRHETDTRETLVNFGDCSN